jgi:polar amino acid transport system substrate-binding protein
MLRTTSALLSLLFALAARAELPATIKACDDGDEWPPFTYFARDGAVKGQQVVGYSVDYLREILEKRGIKLSVALMPWKRCQTEVERGRYVLALNAASSAERDKAYLMSLPYYTLTGVYFYATQRPAPKVNGPDDLRKLKVCGMAGYNYAPFGIPVNEIDTRAVNFPAAVGRLKAGRCDVLLVQQEIVLGQRLSSGFNIAAFPEFAMAPIPNLEPAPYHMMLSRKLPYANELLTLINQGIQDMTASRRGEQLAQRYLRPGG